jgi:ABC-type polysaccharide/polyol phosphate transport system ATPase subunit
MSDEKLKRTVTGMIVAGTILILVLLLVIVYQIVCMGVKKSQIKKYEDEIAHYEEIAEQLDQDLNYYGSDYAKWIAAMKGGYENGNVDK